MAEIKEDLKNVDDQQEKERSETSFDDLPDDVHIQIMEKLDFASCLKLRVNRRLNRVRLAVKNELRSITINIHATCCKVDVVHSNTRSSFESSDFESLETGLLRLSQNSRIGTMHIIMHVMPNEENCRVVDVLLQYEVHSWIFGASDDQQSAQWNLPQINLPTILALSQTVVSFVYDFVCNSLSAQDLCFIRKIMLESDCKLRRFIIKLDMGMEKVVVEACLGVAIDDFSGPLCGRMYRATDDTVELYSNRARPTGYSIGLFHFENDLKTTACLGMLGSKLGLIFLKYIDDGNREYSLGGTVLHKIQPNHFYRAQ